MLPCLQRDSSDPFQSGQYNLLTGRKATVTGRLPSVSGSPIVPTSPARRLSQFQDIGPCYPALNAQEAIAQLRNLVRIDQISCNDNGVCRPVSRLLFQGDRDWICRALVNWWLLLIQSKHDSRPRLAKRISRILTLLCWRRRLCCAGLGHKILCASNLYAAGVYESASAMRR